MVAVRSPTCLGFLAPKPIFKAIQHQGFNCLALELPNARYKTICLTKRRNFKPDRQQKLGSPRQKFHTRLKRISIECQHISNANQTFRYLTVSLLNEVMRRVGVISAIDNLRCSHVIRKKNMMTGIKNQEKKLE